MRRVLLAIWATLIWLFVVLIPIQFYLAGHGAMEGAYSAAHPRHVMGTAWDPHIALGYLMGLVSLLALLAVLGARPARPATWMTVGLFIFMLVQSVLPAFYDSASTRWIAALHGVNALVLTGLAIMLARRSRPFLPFVSRDPEMSEALADAPAG